MVTNGRAHDLRFVADDYVLQMGELEGEGDTLPDIDDLSSVPDPIKTEVEDNAIRFNVFRADTDRQDLVNNIAKKTPAQIKTYVQNNVTDLASAKILMAKILLLVGASGRDS
jgi:hypothetical protein